MVPIPVIVCSSSSLAMCNPVARCGLGETDHCSLDVLLYNVPFAFPQEIDDPLMRFEVFVPNRSTSPARDHPQPDKCKEGSQHSLGVIQQMFIPGESAQFKMELQIVVEHAARALGLGGLAHTIHDGLQGGEVWLGKSGKMCGKPLNRAAHL